MGLCLGKRRYGCNIYHMLATQGTFLVLEFSPSLWLPSDGHDILPCPQLPSQISTLVGRESALSSLFGSHP